MWKSKNRIRLNFQIGLQLWKTLMTMETKWENNGTVIYRFYSF
jgi:hypothetical protein